MTQAHENADATHGNLGALQKAQHQQKDTGANNLSLPAAYAGNHKSPSDLGDGHQLHPDGRGFVYLAAVINWYSRRMLDWRVSISMDSKGCWRNNVFIERLWQSIKYEDVYLQARTPDM